MGLRDRVRRLEGTVRPKPSPLASLSNKQLLALAAAQRAAAVAEHGEEAVRAIEDDVFRGRAR